MCASGVIFGCLFAFIGASEQIFDEVFGRGDKFCGSRVQQMLFMDLQQPQFRAFWV